MDNTKLSDFMKGECISLLCGEQIGQGLTRAVYECAVNPRWVVKIEDDVKSFDNIMEWRLWDIASPHLRNWLAACIAISDNGRVLVMERTKPLRASSSEWRSRVPALFTDLHRDNWGTTSRAGLVCHDYGNILPEEGASRYRKANWR